MNIKKAVVALMLPLFIFTACGKAEENKPAKEPAASEITAAIMSEITIPSAVEKDINSLNAYFEVDTTQIEDMSVYVCGSGAFPDELIVLKMSSEEQAKTVAQSLVLHLENQTNLYRDYTPDELYKLETAAVDGQGKYVMLFICEKNARAIEIAESLF